MATNSLTRIDEFREVLADYHLSDDAKRALADIQLALLVGPSSSGRNTIINHLVRLGGYHSVVSDTTRKPRVNNGVLEQDGREYWFRSEDEILEDLHAGRFLEAAIIHNQQVSGISIRELQLAANEHQVAINEIEVKGADSIRAINPHTRFIFVLPPSFDEWMARMYQRGELPADEKKRRLESAAFEIATALDRDTFVVNDTFVHAAVRIDDVIRGNGSQADDQDAAKALARELLYDTEAHLASLK
jgi:guanylate kinase